MRCPCESGEGIEVILACLGGQLRPETREDMERHIEECPACQELVLAQQVVLDALDDWKAPVVSDGFDRQVRERIAAEGDGQSWWRRLWAPAGAPLLRPALAVATLCLVLAAGILFRISTTPPDGPVATVEPVDIEQMEQVVEDLEMLYLLDPIALEDEDGTDAPPDNKVGRSARPAEIVRCG